MTDMLKTIVPKSDQLNADSLFGGQTKTIKITKGSSAPGEQPISINYEGDDGKPYKPCKSMRRVLVNIWGSDGNAYVGRSLTLYCDDKVTWGGAAVGGIRISHMSHISAPVTMALTATKQNRKPFTVQPLTVTDVMSNDQKKALYDEAEAAIGKIDHEEWVLKYHDKLSKNISKPRFDVIVKKAAEFTGEVK